MATHLLASNGSDGTRSGHLTGAERLGGNLGSLSEQGFLSSVVSDLGRLDLQYRNPRVVA